MRQNKSDIVTDISSAPINPIPVAGFGTVAAEYDNVYYTYNIIMLSQPDASSETSTESKIKVLKEAVLGYKKTLDYNGLYISFLMDQISEEEFTKESEKYVIRLSEENSPEIHQKIKLLVGLTGESYTPSEISDIFSIEEDIAESILFNLEKSDRIK